MTTQRILIVDDELHIRSVIRIKLEGAGFGVTECTNGGRALDSIIKTKPDMIITDHEMPGEFNGLDMIRKVRDRERGMKQSADDCTPILMITGSVAIMEKIEKQVYEFPRVKIMSKPFSPRNLLKLVKEELSAACP